MKVINEKDYTKEQEFVVIKQMEEGERTPCRWTKHCPSNSQETCNECPAKYVGQPLTHEEAVKWWKEQ